MNLPPKPFKSYLFVGIQFICLILILFTGSIIPTYWLYRGLAIVGVVLGLWALHTMTIRNLTAFPDVRSQATLITHGPYRYVRHPMYSALLLFTLALVLDNISEIRIVVWIILLGDLLMKLTYEEFLLETQFEQYREYKNRTARLLPYLY